MRGLLALLIVPAAAACVGDALPNGARAEDCGKCHAAEYAEWSSSRLAAGVDGGATSPVFAALLPHVESAWGSDARARCVSCHAPGFGEDRGVGCVACHAAVGNRGVQNGAVVVDLGAPLAASRASTPTTAHGTEVRDYLTSAELCSTCHVVHGPGLFEETTLDELRAGADAGKGCVDCHMRPVAGTERADHRFAGVDPAWGGDAQAAQAATAAAVELLGRALTLELRDDGVHLANRGGGHAVPTGVAFLRDVWIDVRITDASGAVFDLPRVIALGAKMTRAGQAVDLPTDADLIEPRVLGPGEERVAAVAVPAGAIGPVTVEATLRARAVSARALAALGVNGAAVPEMVVATAKR
jgi:hypothetical protein